MSGPRQFVSDALAAALGDGWALIPYDTQVTPSGKTVMFYRSTVEQTPEAPMGSWQHEITLYVATAKQVGPDALDALDEALDEVLVALYEADGIAWSTATYKVLFETIPAFEVKVQVWTNVAPTQPEPTPEEE